MTDSSGASDRLERFYKINGPDHWGDYGSILVAGYSSFPEREDGVYSICRTGPFVPPITILEEIVVTNDFRADLLGEFPSLRFKPTVVEKAVEIAWEEWDWDEEEPQFYPPEHEPENYIEALYHSPHAVEEMGHLWHLDLDVGIASDLETIPRELHKTLVVDPSSWSGEDFLLVKPRVIAYPIVSESAKIWLEEEVGKWLTFEEIKLGKLM